MNEKIICEENILHEDIIARVRENMPSSDKVMRVSELFKVFGDITRSNIICVLFQAEMCVCDIANILGMTQSAISHQLRVLKQNQLVKFRREGKTIYYSLADDHVTTIINQGMDHIRE